MNILVIGGGGREHALTWRLVQSPSVKRVIASPGNPGIAKIATCVPSPDRVEGYIDIAAHFGVELTVVGPEAPLVDGIVDRFRARGLQIVGPTQSAARLEGSKIFAKQFFARAEIPTARSIQTETLESANHALKQFGLPVVIKADGLASGKGVIIAATEQEAADAATKLGPNLVIEEYLEGEEVSFIGLSNGHKILPFPPSQDHKRIFDGDRGPNTGGMGAYCDSRILTDRQSGEIMECIMNRAIRQMQREGTPFTGFLYAGLMMTGQGPKLLEFNVRLGDPEAQVLLHRFQGDFLSFLQGSDEEVCWSEPSVCVVLAAEGYPAAPTVGAVIQGIREAEEMGATVFHAGTREDLGALHTNGGRVLGVTASAPTLQSAIASAYRGASAIQFEGMQFRRDIGQKGLRRW